MLRRMKCLFKDYDKTPIGFGVVVFCIAKSDCRSAHHSSALQELHHDNSNADHDIGDFIIITVIIVIIIIIIVIIYLFIYLIVIIIIYLSLLFIYLL